MLKPRIYVACLAAYNNGKLHGAWIDCDRDLTEIHDDIQEMLKKSPEPGAEEWEIHDHEGLANISSASLEDIAAQGQFIAEHGDVGAGVLDECDGDLDYAEEVLEDGYGCYSSEMEFVEQLIDDCYDLESMGNLANYFDYEKFHRDLFLHDGYFSVETDEGCHIFRKD